MATVQKQLERKCQPCGGSGKLSVAHADKVVLKNCLFCGGRGCVRSSKD
jgi:hypothetical protein